MEKQIRSHRGIEITVKHDSLRHVWAWSFDYILNGFEVHRTFAQDSYADALEQAKSEIDELYDTNLVKVLN